MYRSSRTLFHPARVGLAPYVALTIALVAAAGCGNPGVKKASDPASDMGSFRTYEILSMVPTGEMSFMDAESASVAARSALNDRGFKESDDPDLLVAMHYVQGKHAETDAERLGYEYDLEGADADVAGDSRYDEGALFIDFVDAATNSAIWRGKRPLLINESVNHKERGAKITAIVEDIVGEFPRGR